MVTFIEEIEVLDKDARLLFFKRETKSLVNQ